MCIDKSDVMFYSSLRLGPTLRFKGFNMTSDLTGRRFGKLVVIELLNDSNIQSESKYLCSCDCGSTISLSYRDLIHRKRSNCGCIIVPKHGGTIRDGSTKHRTYKSWESMKARCYNPNSKGYIRYGGRGISVCDRWMSFENFYADMGDRPENTTLDRIDNNGNYEPSNCKWSTPKEQQDNTSKTLVFNINGNVVKSAASASEVTGLNSKTIESRYYQGFSDEEVLRPELGKRRESLLKDCSSYIGRRHGKLVVVDTSRGGRENRVLLHCRCDCGKNHTVLIGNFEKTFSCGCLTTTVEKRTTEISVGDIFGYWTVIDLTKDEKRRQVCVCKCKCGNVKNVDSYSLRSGKSTGCLSCRMIDVRNKRC